jgi:hypothetical protein
LLYIVIAILTSICFAIIVLECAMQNTKAHLLFALKKFKHFSLQLLRTMVLSLFLMSKHIERVFPNRNPPKVKLTRDGIDNISVNNIQKIEVKPQQQ